MCCKLLVKFTKLYQELPSFHEIFNSSHYFAQHIDLKKYPSEIRVCMKEMTAENVISFGCPVVSPEFC
jgi:hypothetical protein